jgi:hypothetical protein
LIFWPPKATSIEEIRKRTGTKPMSPENFDGSLGRCRSTAKGRAVGAGAGLRFKVRIVEQVLAEHLLRSPRQDSIEPVIEETRRDGSL